MPHRGLAAGQSHHELSISLQRDRAGLVAWHRSDRVCGQRGSFPRVFHFPPFHSSSVLSPGDHPTAFCVGSTRHGNLPLMSSSRGYRHHSIQRALPAFSAPGYEIPALSASSRCKPVSGTSVSAPVLAGKLGLVLEWAHTQGWRPSVGEMKCLLLDAKYDRKRECCMFPDHVQIPRDNALVVSDAWFGVRGKNE